MSTTLPPVTAVLLADFGSFYAQLDEAISTLEEFGGSTEEVSGQISEFQGVFEGLGDSADAVAGQIDSAGGTMAAGWDGALTDMTGATDAAATDIAASIDAMTASIAGSLDALVAEMGGVETALDGIAGKTTETAAVAGGGAGEIGASAGFLAGGLEKNLAGKAVTAVAALGTAFTAFGVDEAVKFQSALDAVQNQTNVTQGELNHLANQSKNLAKQTGLSAEDIVGAYGAVEAAGYKRAQADKTVAAASKLAVIAQQPVLTTTQALIAAQELGITKGMSSAKIADVLTIALKGNEQGLTGVFGLLQGKVGSAFAAYHQSAGEAVSVANVLSEAQYSNTRAVSTFVNKLGALEGPMQTTEVENGKLTTTSASYVNSLKDVGLNVYKVRDAFAGPNGLVTGMQYLETVSHGSLTALHNDLTAIFGATGVGLGQLIIKNLPQISATTNAAAKASGKGLNDSFNVAMNQIDNKFHKIEQDFIASARSFGEAVLPWLTKGADVLIDAFQYLDKHPLLKDISGAALGTAVGGAMALEAGKIIAKLPGISNLVQSNGTLTRIFGSNSAKQIGLLQEIADNTAKTAGEGGASDAEEAGAGGSAMTTFGKYVVVFGAGVLAFEGASKFLETAEGKKVGNFLVNNNVLGVSTVANELADVLHKRVYASTGPTTTTETYLKSIGEWGNYMKMVAADSQANYGEVAKLSAAISKRENKTGKSTLTASVKVHLH